MAINYANIFNRRSTPQSQPIPGSNQVHNSGGGYSWQVDDWTRLDRFLILGAEGGTYYITERDLVKQNHDAIVRCIKADGIRAVNRIVEISDAGRAPKNDPAIFALAFVVTHGDAQAKAHAFANLGKVCHLHGQRNVGGQHSSIHPAEALRQYRSEFVGDAKAVVVGMTSNGFTLADPNDRGMLDVVGFDTTVPAVIADFVRN